jgi:hypothetical protein
MILVLAVSEKSIKVLTRGGATRDLSRQGRVVPCAAKSPVSAVPEKDSSTAFPWVEELLNEVGRVLQEAKSANASGVTKQRFEAVVHVLLNMAVKQGEA